MQSAPTGCALHGGVPTDPMITVSPGRATSGFVGLAVILVSRAVLRPLVVRVARVLVRVRHVDVPVRRKVRIEGKSPHASVVEGVDVGAEVDERRREHHAVLDDPYDAVLLPDEEAAVGRKS